MNILIIVTGIVLFIIIAILIWHTMMVAEELRSIYDSLQMINRNFKKHAIENSTFNRSLLDLLENKHN